MVVALQVGRIASIEENHNTKEMAETGASIAISIEATQVCRVRNMMCTCKQLQLPELNAYGSCLMLLTLHSFLSQVLCTYGRQFDFKDRLYSKVGVEASENELRRTFDLSLESVYGMCIVLKVEILTLPLYRFPGDLLIS